MMASLSQAGKFELAGGASISNTAMLGTVGHSALEILSSSSYRRSHNGDISDQLLVGAISTGNIVSISAGGLTSGDVFRVVVPNAGYSGRLFSFNTDTGIMMASLSQAGKFELAGGA